MRATSRPGQPVEVTFKFMPGKVYTGKVESRAAGDRQRAVAALGHRGDADGDPVGAVRRARAGSMTTDFANRLPAGATGAAAIFTDHVKAAHVIRKVLLRQIAILNYVNPF